MPAYMIVTATDQRPRRLYLRLWQGSRRAGRAVRRQVRPARARRRAAGRRLRRRRVDGHFRMARQGSRARLLELAGIRRGEEAQAGRRRLPGAAHRSGQDRWLRRTPTLSPLGRGTGSLQRARVRGRARTTAATCFAWHTSRGRRWARRRSVSGRACETAVWTGTSSDGSTSSVGREPTSSACPPSLSWRWTGVSTWTEQPPMQGERSSSMVAAIASCASGTMR